MVRYLYIISGLVCVSLAYIGIAMPGIPTTPFLLLAVWFFSKSSNRLELWITQHKIFGQVILDWKEGKGIRSKSKIYAVILIIISFSSTIYIAFPYYIDIIFVLGAIALCTFIISRPNPDKK